MKAGRAGREVGRQGRCDVPGACRKYGSVKRLSKKPASVIKNR